MASTPSGSSSAPSTVLQSLQLELDKAEEELNTPLFRSLEKPGIFDYLKWAGFKGNYHTLSVLSTYGRTIVRVDDPGLHLMWKSGLHTEWIKPFPSVFAHDQLDVQNLGFRSRGLLYSYTKLIRSELDFQMANELKLLPTEFKNDSTGWKRWNDFVEKLWGGHAYPWLSDADHHQTGCTGVCKTVANDPCRQYRDELQRKMDAKKISQEALLANCHPRYKYGDLRLDRINWIVRLNFKIKGLTYFASRSPKDTMVARHSKFITAYLVYVALILTAMQVGLQASTTPKWVSQAFRYFSYTIILFTGGQIPLIAGFFVLWVAGQLLTFWWLNRKPERAERALKQASKRSNV